MNLLFLLLFVLDIPYLALSLRFNTPRANDPPSLGIQRVEFSQLYNGKPWRWYFYTSVVKYSDDVQKLFPEDAQIAGLAFQAFDEASALNRDRSHPFTGMNVLLVGNQAIFSSPLRSKHGNSNVHGKNVVAPSFFYDIVPTTAPIRQQLLACAIADGRRGTFLHSTKGNCGEILGMQIWLLQNPNTEWPKNAKARTTHVLGGTKTINPCKDERNSNAWGCLQWAQGNGISWLEKTILPADAQKLSQVPSEVMSMDTLWCDSWQQRSGNVHPSPSPSPSPTPSPAPDPPNNKRKAPPSFDPEDGFDEDQYNELWDILGL